MMPAIRFMLIALLGIIFSGCSSTELAKNDTDVDQWTVALQQSKEVAKRVQNRKNHARSRMERN